TPAATPACPTTSGCRRTATCTPCRGIRRRRTLKAVTHISRASDRQNTGGGGAASLLESGEEARHGRAAQAGCMVGGQGDLGRVLERQRDDLGGGAGVLCRAVAGAAADDRRV